RRNADTKMAAANDDMRVFSTSQGTDFTKGQRLTKYPSSFRGHAEHPAEHACVGLNLTVIDLPMTLLRDQLRAAEPAARKAARIPCGVAGSSSIETPKGASASLIALRIAAGAPIAPPSPRPFALVMENASDSVSR